MGLKDPSPLTTELDGLDSGLGEAPPTCDKKIYSPTKLENVSFQPAFFLDEDHHSDLQPSKKKAKKNVEPDMILDPKQKKSLEKVAEWLMKVPSEQSLELENPKDAGHDSGSCPSTSTLDLEQPHCKANPTRVHAKALVDKVFGATYGRRGKEILKTTETAPEMACFNLSVINTSKDNRNDKEEEQLINEQEKNSNILKGGVEVLEDCRGNSEPPNMSENDKTQKDEVPQLVSVIEEQQPETKVKRTTRSSLQHVDSDLLNCAQKRRENTEEKSTHRGSRSAKSEKAKTARMPKPLVLVTVENLETSPNIRPSPTEVQIHIENYPSSGDQEVPLGRRTRRSRRLQVLTKEDYRKEKSRSSVPEKEHDSKSPNFECEILDNVNSPDYKERKWQADGNGCVYTPGMEEIENMDSGEKTSFIRPEEDTEHTPARLPNTETLFQTAYSVAVVPNSAEIVGESTEQPPNTVQLLTKLGEIEHDQQNDSEQDTEQLVKTFKATKRKSFHLGSGPDLKRSRLLVQKKQSAGAEENQYVCSGDQTAAEHKEPVTAEITVNQVLFHSQNMSGSDLILPSSSPSLKRKASGLSGCSAEGGNCVSASSPLPPNLESKHVVQSFCPLVPTERDSICFATEIPSQILKSKANFVMEDTQSSAVLHTSNASTSKEILNVQSFLTPNGLEMPVPNKETNYSQGSTELSACRKRTKAQKLDSSSDSSDCAEEEFPCLAKIFNETALPDNHSSHPSACPSPDCLNPSQTSVDLFGTPNECKFPSLAYFL